VKFLRSRRTPTLTGSCQPRIPVAGEIKPVRVERLDQHNLLGSPSAFELLLAVDRSRCLIERFPVQQPLDVVSVRESVDAVELVLKDTLVQVAGHADVERS